MAPIKDAMWPMWRGLLLMALSVSLAASDPFISADYACSVCELIIKAGPQSYDETCARFDGCAMVSLKNVEDAENKDVVSACQALNLCPIDEAWMSVTSAASDLPFDLRVSRAFGPSGYAKMRVSAITEGAYDWSNGTFRFDYDAPFIYRWLDKHLYSSLVDVTPGAATQLDLGGFTVTLPALPAQAAPVKGAIIADPCISSRWVTCLFGEHFDTFNRFPAFLNALAAGPDPIDFWQILGDNFYDKTGTLSTAWFEQLETATKATPFATAFGNHDYWVHGTPESATDDDDYSNGKLQFYAQDTAASVLQSDATSFLNLSVNPNNLSLTTEEKRPDVSNSVWWHAIGDMAFVGYSGAYTYQEVQPYFAQACEWLGTVNANATFLVGHWNDPGMGCKSNMDVPDVFTEISALPGCAALAAKNSLRYVMGHTHCNSVMAENTGFMVAGQGMSGCGNFGVPVFDTTTQPGRVQIHYFSLETEDVAAAATSCVRNQGYGACLSDYATTWLDVPFSA